MIGSIICAAAASSLCLYAGYALAKFGKKKAEGRFQGKYKYCPGCAEELEMRMVDGAEKLACTCGFVHWNNPHPVAIVLIPHRDGGFVFVKRKNNPRAGKFALPGGFIEPYESALEGAIREAKEETGLDIEIDRLLFVSSPKGVNEILVFYLAKTVFEQHNAGSDAELCIVSSLSDLPDELAFETHRQAILDYMHGPRA